MKNFTKPKRFKKVPYCITLGHSSASVTIKYFRFVFKNMSAIMTTDRATDIVISIN